MFLEHTPALSIQEDDVETEVYDTNIDNMEAGDLLNDPDYLPIDLETEESSDHEDDIHNYTSYDEWKFSERL